jgi:glycosyltransferase involved in cell wall biosynthesis
MKPKISVVTPSYNQGQFIEETICSVLDQHYPNLEYIIIDGGSTDQSIEIIRRYEKHLAFWVSEKDRGAADAIAKGFARTSGSILAYLNSDDTYIAGALNAVAETMASSEIEVVYGDTYWIDTAGTQIGQRRQTPFDALGYLYGGFDLQQPSTFWRRQLYLDVSGINSEFKFAFDADLFFRFVKAGARFRHIKQFLSCYRIHPQSKSSTESDVLQRELATLRKENLEYAIDSLHAKWFRNRARLRRTLSYLTQGDALWLMRRIPDRFSSRRSPVTVGPKARWM